MGGGQKQKSTRIGNLQVQQTGYNVTIPVVLGTNKVKPILVYYTDFKATKNNDGGGKGGGGAGKSYSYNATVVLLVGEGGNEISFGKLNVNKKRYDQVDDIGLVPFYGDDGQQVWDFFNDAHTEDGVNFYRFAYLAGEQYALTTSASIGDHAVEVNGFYRGSGDDAEVHHCIQGILTNDQWGLGWDAGKVDAMAQMASYCAAYGIEVSPLLDEQTSAAEVVERLAKIANAGLVWSGGILRCIPYSDMAYGGYTPSPTTGVYLDLDDFIISDGEEPVRIRRRLQADCFNKVIIEYKSRLHGYETRTAEALDQGDIDNYRLRAASTATYNEICKASVANRVAQAELQRSLYIVFEYEFNLSWKHCLLEPMDVVYLTEPNVGLNNTPVRITKIKDGADFLRLVTAEEMPWGASHTEALPTSELLADETFANVAVGPINAPVVFIAPAKLAVGGYEVWVALSNSDANYGGVVVHSSFDNATYKRRGTYYGNAVYGSLLAALASGSDPDTNPAHELKVDIAVSGGTLASMAADDAALILVNDEFAAFRFAKLIGTKQYDLFSPILPATEPFLRRGLYGSTQGAASGARFAVCDDRLLKVAFKEEDVGKTLYLKFQAFNVFNDGLEDLSGVSAYSIVLTEPLSGGTNFEQWGP
jgi:hypothetical protein